MLTIDGSMGEGGGQILRTALTLSLVTGQAFRLENLRAHRTPPGLKPQHLKAVEAAAAIGRAKVHGRFPGSQTLTFEPEPVQPAEYAFDIGTAGSIALVLQTLYLPLALAGAPSRVTVRGGTHVPWSPSFDFLDCHWQPVLDDLGIHLRLEMERAGFYPPGGGIVHMNVAPTKVIRGWNPGERGRLLGIAGISAVARLPESIAERQRDRARQRLRARDLDADIDVRTVEAVSPGTFIALVAEFEHGRACYTALGERGKPAETVGEEAVVPLLAFIDGDANVDEHLADQLLLPLALAEDSSRFYTHRPTTHLETNARVIERFTPTRFMIGEDGRVDVAVSPR